MDSRKDKRYLHIAGAFGVGGRFTKAGNQPIDLPIETVAPAHLPMVGGRSESSSGAVVVDGSHIPPAGIDSKILAQLKTTKLLSVGSAHSLAESDLAGPNGPFVSRTTSEVRNVEISGGFSVERCVLHMTSTQAAGAPFPSIRFGDTAILGLKLGGLPLTVHLDLDTFNSYPTQTDFVAHCNKNAGNSAAPLSTFLKDDATGKLHQNQSAYLVGSLVTKIEGRLPEGASIESNGYIIDWPAFGKIILGEILIGPYVRRVTMVRLKHSDEELCSGCSGGSTWP